MMADKKQPWKFCVVGNIKKTNCDDQGILRYGTQAYSGGTKVYLCGKFWNADSATISVIGLNRFKRYAVNDVPTTLIENVRGKRVYRPAVLEIMNDWEFADCWWGDTEEDRVSVKRFVEKWTEA
jgi:hypothetical protein